MKHRFRPVSKWSQAGATLIISLVFLVVLTMLGLGMFFSTTSEEKMARNFRDKEVALHAAEAALNEAKMRITGSYNLAAPPSPLPTVLTHSSCYAASPPAGLSCDENTLPSIDLFAGSSPPGTNLGSYNASSSPTITGLSVQPRYLIISYANPGVCSASTSGDCFQIIAQARGRLSSTQVKLVELFNN